MMLFWICNGIVGKAAELLPDRITYLDSQMLTGTVSQRNWSENGTTASLKPLPVSFNKLRPSCRLRNSLMVPAK